MTATAAWAMRAVDMDASLRLTSAQYIGDAP
jgi:hypothetical protein